MAQVVVVGLDIAKSVFQLHGVDRDGGVVVRRRLRRSRVLLFFATVESCRIGIEACATGHYWARELGGLGHDVRLMARSYVKPYVKRPKNDAADAEAICEAVGRPTMRFVAVKTAEQQSVMMLHRTRLLLMRQRTRLPSALKPTTWNSSFPISIAINAIAGASWSRWLLKVAPPQLGA
jgi:transposase